MYKYAPVSVYLGLDSSTQSLTASLIRAGDDGRETIGEHALPFDTTFPEFGTTNGVIRGDASGVVAAPPLLWVTALDRMMGDLVTKWPREMAELAAVSGSAQQHGSVYLNARGLARLSSLGAREPLAPQLAGSFSRPLSPVWMDSSTTTECREIERAVGGKDVLARRTGSRAFERFTGPQIRAFAKREADAYRDTARIHLVSSFMAALLAGADAPIDYGDGSGMNLMDVSTRTWWPEAVEATAAALAGKLPPIQASWLPAGTLAEYWQQRYELPAARVIPWSGDNPCSLIGSGLVREGRLAISLGTSDTVCGMMRDFRRHDGGIGYVSASPTGEFMGTTTFMNGSLARERVRDMYGLDWARFSAALASTPPGNQGALMLPWFDPEITPHVSAPGVRRAGLDASDVSANVRAIVEGQMMAMANHTRWMSPGTSVIHATGGASGNRAVLQVMANVFNAEVVRSRTGNSAALGAALRAFHADRLASGRPISWDDVIEGFADPQPDWHFRPDPAAVKIYVELREKYASAETDALASPSSTT